MSDNLTEIKNEYIKWKKSKSLTLNTISVGKITDYEWIASFIGPKKAGYKGGLFKLIIKILENYPDIPEICFKYPVFHPNVQLDNDETINAGGYHVCCSYINNWSSDRSKWLFNLW
jgi:ubiquitin-protein ligase